MERFICDVHLGKLAKWLRMLGFDTAYQNSFTNSDLAAIASAENRTLLSRNSSFEKNSSINFFLIADENPEKQLQDAIKHFQLKDKFQPFIRCITCNGLLEPASKNEVEKRLKKNTAKYFNEFWECSDCKRIYWKGSHYERMQKSIEVIKKNSD